MEQYCKPSVAIKYLLYPVHDFLKIIFISSSIPEQALNNKMLKYFKDMSKLF